MNENKFDDKILTAVGIDIKGLNCDNFATIELTKKYYKERCEDLEKDLLAMIESRNIAVKLKLKTQEENKELKETNSHQAQSILKLTERNKKLEKHNKWKTINSDILREKNRELEKKLKQQIRLQENLKEEVYTLLDNKDCEINNLINKVRAWKACSQEKSKKLGEIYEIIKK